MVYDDSLVISKPVPGGYDDIFCNLVTEYLRQDRKKSYERSVEVDIFRNHLWSFPILQTRFIAND